MCKWVGHIRALLLPVCYTPSKHCKNSILYILCSCKNSHLSAWAVKWCVLILSPSVSVMMQQVFSFLKWKLLSLSVLPPISLRGRSGGVTFIRNFIFGHIFLFESFAGHVTGKCLIELVADKRHFSCFLQRQAIGVKVCPPESFAHRHAPKVTRPAMVREIKGVKVWNQNNPQIWARKRVMTVGYYEQY